MLVYFDSTAVHVLQNQEENRAEHTPFKPRGVFLNFASEPIHIQSDVYVPKDKPDWRATMAFVSDDILELAATITSLHDNILTVSN